MADEQRHGDRGPVDEGNGGPVMPGVGPRSTGAHGNGGNGLGGPPALREPEGAVITPEPAKRSAPKIKHTKVAGAWIAVTLSTVVLIFLLVFIVQNLDPARIRFLGAEASLPVGVALLFAAALGVLLVAIPGYLRILQLRRLVRRRDTD